MPTRKELIMNQRVKITKRIVDSTPFATEASKPVYLRDTELTGFALKVGCTSKTYIVERRVASKNVRTTIGKHGPWTAERARVEAQRLLGEMAAGINPVERDRQEATQAVTLNQAFEDYLAARHLADKTIREYRRAITMYLADFAEKPINTITKEAISARFRLLSTQSGAATANAAMRALRAILSFAMANYEVAGTKVITENPVTILSQTRAWHRIPRRQGHIRRTELGSWLEAIQSLTNTVARDYLLFLLFTGMRREEAAGLRWDKVDFANRVVTIPVTKNHDPLTLPLSDYLVDLLRSRRTEAESDSPFVFPAEGKVGYIRDVRKSLAHVEAATGVRITPHDLRRTFITMADNLDISAYAVKRLVNHRIDSGDVTAGYIISDVERLRGPMQMITEEILRHAELV
jgi:integrase